MTRKQTSAKVSKLAARYVAITTKGVMAMHDAGDTARLAAIIRTLAASCLSQDEVKGPYKTVPLSKFGKADQQALQRGEVLIKTAKPRKAKP